MSSLRQFVRAPALAGSQRWLLWRAALIGGAFMVAAGSGYRVVADALNVSMSVPIRLDPPITSLPMTLGAWVGRDVDIPDVILRIAGNDDTVSRVYRRPGIDESVSLYIGYTGRPRTMLGHRPTNCFVNAGHTHVSAENITLSAGALSSPAVIHSFLKHGVADERTLVLHYYVLNGHVTVNESSFWGIGWRTPNLARDARRYVAQVQVTTRIGLDAAADRRRVIEFAQASLPQILALLPESSEATGAVD